jgi:4-hydroxy-tetrahydrodipicolinate synthase
LRSNSSAQQAGIGLAVRTHLLHRRGAIASPFVRKPVPKLSAQDLADIDRPVARQDGRLRDLG